MKIQFFRMGLAGLSLALLPLVNGCEADSADAAIVAAPPTEEVEPTPSDDNALAPVPATPPEAPKELAANPEPAPADGDQKTLPTSFNRSSAAAEIAKMAQAGVDQGVLLAYVTNSQKVFGLSSDEIVYLNDLGVPGGVITAIIEHDKAMKEFWANSAKEQTPQPTVEPEPTQVEQTASAPSYVEQPAVQAEPTTVVNENYFYDSLSPYGTWVTIDGYGRCWQPTVVVGNPNWRPYCDRGRWVYTDCGWYWMSDYSWGSVAFHYGRWFNHPRWGWCWWPNNVWGPSWVTWRSGGEYCGWAPLPPAAVYSPGFGFTYYGSSVSFGFSFGLSAACYTFVPTTHFCDPHPWHYSAPHSTATRIYNNTTIINNFGSRNNTVVNRGIDPNHIRSVSKTEIRQVTIREATTRPGSGIRTDRMERDGRTLTVSRPQFAGNSASGRTVSTDSPRRIETPRDGGAGAGANNPPVRDHRGQNEARSRAGFAADVPGVTPPTGANTPGGEVPGVTPPPGARHDGVPGVTRPVGAQPGSSVAGVTPPAGARSPNGEVPGVTPPPGANSPAGSVAGVTRPAGARPGSDAPGVTPPRGANTPNGEVPGVTRPPGARHDGVPGVTRPVGARPGSDVAGVTPPAGARSPNGEVPGVTPPPGANSRAGSVPGVTPPAGARPGSDVPGVTPPAGARTPANSVPGVTPPTRPSRSFADNPGRSTASPQGTASAGQAKPLILIGNQSSQATTPSVNSPAAQSDNKETQSSSSLHIIGRINSDSNSRNRYQIYDSSRPTRIAPNNGNYNSQSPQTRSAPQIAENTPTTPAQSYESRSSASQDSSRNSRSYRPERYQESVAPRAPAQASPAPSQSYSRPVSPPPQSRSESRPAPSQSQVQSKPSSPPPAQSAPRSQPQSQPQSGGRSDNGQRGRN